MTVLPVHDDLQNRVQLGEGDVFPDLYPSPNGRLYILQRDLNLVDLLGFWPSSVTLRLPTNEDNKNGVGFDIRVGRRSGPG